MKTADKISNAVIRRLPKYLRVLEDLNKVGVERISSGELSELIGYTASQIRQDLNHFGGFGQQGYGYNVKELHGEILAILGLDRPYKMVLVGCGKLGQALSNYTHEYGDNFTLAGLFDVKKELIGTKIAGTTIRDISELPTFLRKNKIDIGVMTVPPDQAGTIAKLLVGGGVRGIWNFAPVDLDDIEEVPVENVHIWDSLEALAYHIVQKEKQD